MAKIVDEELRERIWDCARKGDAAGIAHLFRDKSEPERKALRPVTRELQSEAKRVQRTSFDSLRDPNGNRLRVNLYQFELVCNTCVVATEGKASLLKLSGWHFARESAALTRALSDRNPPWLQEFLEEALDKAGGDIGPWFVVARGLFVSGRIRKPASPGYTLGMIAALTGWDTQKEAKSLASHLLVNRDLLDDVWPLFVVEGGGEVSLANAEKFVNGGDAFRWSVALKELSEQGHLDRQRLLDESLNALARDFSQYRAGWHSRFHEYMQPTPAERVQRVEAYCGLLTSKIPPTVTFALKALQAVQRAKRLPPLPFLTSVERALLAEQKGTVKLAVRMLEGFAKDKASRAAALSAATTALQHPAGEVQQAVLKLLRKYGVPDEIELADHAQHLAPSVLQEFEDVLGHSQTPEAPSLEERDLQEAAAALPAKWAGLAGVDSALHALQQGEVAPALDLNEASVPRLNPESTLEPITDLDQLIECASSVLEQPDDPDEIERMIDGICRLCDQRPTDFEARTAQLAKRAQYFATREIDVARDLAEVNVHRTVAHIVQDWLGTKDSRSVHEGRYWDTVYLPRLNELAPRLKQRHPFQPLSTPTHRGGWLDPRVLATRVRSYAELPRADLILALVRLAPDQRAEALEMTPSGGGGDGMAALRYALGGPLPSSRPDDFGLWHAAATARSFGGGDSRLAEHFGALGEFFKRPEMPWRVKVRKSDSYTFHEFSILLDGGPHDADNTKQITTTLRGAMPQVNTWGWHVTAEAARWVAIHLPTDLELYFGGTAFLLANNIDWWEAQWGNKALLEPLLDPDRPMSPMATLCLTLALAAKQAGEHGLATDILISAIEDGRIDGCKLGECMGSLLSTGLIKPPRWAKTLAEAARVSPLHAQVVRVAIEHAMATAGDAEPPRGLKNLIELCYELAVAPGESITSPEARSYLSRIKGTSGLGRVAKSLLDLRTAAGGTQARQAALHALESRVRRAQRWASY